MCLAVNGEGGIGNSFDLQGGGAAKGVAVLFEIRLA